MAEEDNKEILPARTSAESAADLAVVVVSLVPWLGGPISNVLSGYSSGRRFGRVREALESLTQQLWDFKSDASETYVETDEFEELLEKTLCQAADERDQEKHRIYLDFLIGAIRSQAEAYDEQLRFLRTMEELQGDHIIVLRAYMQPPGPNPGMAGSVLGTLKKGIPDMDEGHIGDLVSQLAGLRLLVDANLGGMMTGGGGE